MRRNVYFTGNGKIWNERQKSPLIISFKRLNELNLNLCNYFFILSLFYVMFTPNVFALSNGPVQAEFSSFESVDATDLVSLPTGDFTYTLPLGEVKAPNGVGYPIALSYHAGIQNEQEATWVGLGWTLNPGAITRIVRGSPDDSYDHVVRSYMYKAGEDNYSFSIGGGFMGVSGSIGVSNKGFQGSVGYGYNIRIGNLLNVGVGARANFGALDNSVSVGLNASVGSPGGASVGLSAGVSVSLSGDQPPRGYFNVNLGLRGGLGSISLSSSGGIGYSVAGGSFSVSRTSHSDKGLDQWSSGWALSLPIGPVNIDLDFSSWGWNYESISFGYDYGFLYNSSKLNRQITSNDITILSHFYPHNTDPRFWNYEQNTTSYRNMSMVDFKYSRDEIHFSHPKLDGIMAPAHKNETEGGPFNGKTWGKVSFLDKVSYSPADLYRATAQGMNGTFKPMLYRPLRVYANSVDSLHSDYMKITDSSGEWKYEEHLNDTHAQEVSFQYSDGIIFKMISEMALNCFDNHDELDFSGSTQFDDFKNFDLDEATAKHDVVGTKIVPIFGRTIRTQHLLEGFVITDLEGKKYYYTLPLFLYEQSSFNSNKEKFFLGEVSDFEYYKGQNNLEFSYRDQPEPYATTWLLTAITGPDYIKRTVEELWIDDFNEVILPHQGDWGYWVRFRYDYGDLYAKKAKGGFHKIVHEEADQSVTTAQQNSVKYIWRDPYNFNIPNATTDKNGETQWGYSAQFGIKDITFLKSIETPTEVAFFRTSPRYDALGVDSTHYPQFENMGIPPEDIEKYNDKGYDNNPSFARKFVEILNIGEAEGIINIADLKNKALSFEVPAKDINPDYLIPDEELLVEGKLIATIKFDADLKYRKYVLGAPVDVRTANKYKERSEYFNLDVFYDLRGYDTNTQAIDMGEILKPVNHPDKDVEKLFINSRFRMQGHESSIGAPKRKRGATMAKCFYFERTQNDTYKFYVVPYYFHSGDGIGPDVEHQTCLKFARRSPINFFVVVWEELEQIKDIVCKGGIWRYKAKGFHDDHETTPIKKKLDEIAWYSKAEFPYWNYETDPEEEGTKEKFEQVTQLGYEYPYSYKRVKLNYTYELARATPNSLNPLDPYGEGGGRLTLKEVIFEGGRDDQSVEMPPYLFSYQGVKKHYTGYDKGNENMDGVGTPLHDKWGYRLTQDEKENKMMHKDPHIGVNWNLSRIMLPSCGSINIEYQRDFINSVWGYLHKVRMDNETKGKRFAEVKDVVSKSTCSNLKYSGKDYDSPVFKTPWGLHVTQPGQLTHGKYTAKIVNDGATDNFYTEQMIRCEKDERFDYEVQEGDYFIIEYGVFRYNHLSDGMLKNYLRMRNVSMFQVTNVLNDQSDYVEFEYKNEIKHLTDLDFGDEYEAVFYATFLPKSLLYCDGIRVTKLSKKSFARNIVTTYNYPRDGGVMEVAPQTAIPWFINTADSIFRTATSQLMLDSGQIRVGNKYSYESIVEDAPLSSALEQNYNTGNSSVSYPWIEVSQYDSLSYPDTRNQGSTKYHFYTFQDKIEVNGETVPIINKVRDQVMFDSNPIDLYKIIDRSSIVSQMKKIEQLDHKGVVMQSSENFYTFSEEMEHIHYKSLSQTFDGSEKPLGYIREHVIRHEDNEAQLDSLKYAVQSVTQVNLSKPFLAKVVSTQMGVKSVATNAFFNALTGEAMVKEEQQFSSDEYAPATKVNVSIPANYLVTEDNTRDKLEQRNIYKLSGATLLSGKSLSGPETVTSLYDYLKNTNKLSSASFNHYNIVQITGPEYFPNNEHPFAFDRYDNITSYTWTGNSSDLAIPDPFSEENIDADIWLSTSKITQTDYFSRGLSEVSILGKKTSVVYHPYGNMVTATVSNASADEIGIFNCSYDDYANSIYSPKEPDPAKDDQYFDKYNGWRRNNDETHITRLSSNEIHFGEKSVEILNNWGPVCSVAVNKEKDYIYSVWVYRASSDPVYLQIAPLDGQGDLIEGTLLEPITTEEGKWCYIEKTISMSQFPALTYYLEPSVGSNGNVHCYIDDIRFYPADALVKTYYYNLNLQMPITIVDENGNAVYVKYDEFGKVIEQGTYVRN